MKLLFYILLLVFMSSCKSDLDLAMERGVQLYDWNRVDESMLEFSHVINSIRQKKYYSKYDLELLSHAHFNLGIAYSKVGNYYSAEKEVSTAISILPKKEYREVLELIKNKQQKPQASSS